MSTAIKVDLDLSLEHEFRRKFLSSLSWAANEKRRGMMNANEYSCVLIALDKVSRGLIDEDITQVIDQEVRHCKLGTERDCE